MDGQRRYDQLVKAERVTLTRAFERAGWRADVFLDRAPLPSYPVPRTVNSTAVTRAARGGTMLGLVGGVVLPVFSIVDDTDVRVTDAALGTQLERVRSRTPAEPGESWWQD